MPLWEGAQRLRQMLDVTRCACDCALLSDAAETKLSVCERQSYLSLLKRGELYWCVAAPVLCSDETHDSLPLVDGRRPLLGA